MYIKIRSNIVDIYLLERTYDNLYRIWLQDGGTKPTPSTADQLRINYSGVLNPLKSLSDQIVYHPVKYKILFGKNVGPFFATQLRPFGIPLQALHIGSPPPKFARPRIFGKRGTYTLETGQSSVKSISLFWPFPTWGMLPSLPMDRSDPRALDICGQ